MLHDQNREKWDDGIWIPLQHVKDGQPDFEIISQPFEHSHVTCAGRGEFHREVMDLQSIQLGQDEIVASLELRFTSNTRASAPAQVHGQLDAAGAVHDLVDHIDGKVGGGIGVGILRAHLRIDEQAEMRVVDLHDIRARLANQFQLALQ